MQDGSVGDMAATSGTAAAEEQAGRSPGDFKLPRLVVPGIRN